MLYELRELTRLQGSVDSLCILVLLVRAILTWMGAQSLIFCLGKLDRMTASTLRIENSDNLRSSFIPTCAECSTAFPAPGVVAVRGESAMANCRQCHRKMGMCWII